MPPIFEWLFGVGGTLVVIFDMVVFSALITIAIGLVSGGIGAICDMVEETASARLAKSREPREFPVEEKAFAHYGRTGTDPAALEADVAALEEVVTKALEPERALGFTPRNMARVKQYSREQIRKELQRLDAGSERFSEDETAWWRALAEEHERLTGLMQRIVETRHVAATNGWRIKRLNVTRDEYRDLERALGGDPDALLGCEVAVVTYESRSHAAEAAFYDSIKAVACSPRTSLRYGGPTDAYSPSLDRRRY